MSRMATVIKACIWRARTPPYASPPPPPPPPLSPPLFSHYDEPLLLLLILFLVLAYDSMATLSFALDKKRGKGWCPLFWSPSCFCRPGDPPGIACVTLLLATASTLTCHLLPSRGTQGHGRCGDKRVRCKGCRASHLIGWIAFICTQNHGR